MAFSSSSDYLEDLPFNHTAGAAHPRFQLQLPRNYPAVRVALIQLAVGRDKRNNIAAAVRAIHRAKEEGAQLVALPECFNCPYRFECFNDYAEPIRTGETSIALSRAAKDAGICVVGGSFPERDGDKLYNTCTVWDHHGNLIATYRKIHLTREESEVFSAGEEITTFVYEGLVIGIGIGSDVVDYNMAAYIAAQDCSLLIYPGAFDMVPGSDRWRAFCRARVYDLKLWVALVNRATDSEAITTFGYTMLIGPLEQFDNIDENPGTLHNVVDLKIALIQLAVGPDKAKNIADAVRKIRKAKEKGANLVVLPECFNSPYGKKYFEEYAEEVPSGETCTALSKVAAETGMFVVGGTIPERCGLHLFNTCTVWNGTGGLTATHRKKPFCDNDERDEDFVVEDRVTTFCYGRLKIGIGICNDLRLFEMTALMAKEGCSLVIYLGAFNMTTGLKQWELLGRARAIDLQVWVALVSPARDNIADYTAWGRTMLINPWGKVVARLRKRAGTLRCSVDLKTVEKFRREIPVRSRRSAEI